MSGGLYKLSVGITLKDSTQAGFAQIERNAVQSQAKTDALRRSLEALGKGFDPQHSLASQAKILELTEKQVALRKEMALSTDAEEKSRIATELKAIDLAKQQEMVRKNTLSLQERLGSIQDKNAFQAQASQEKLEQQAIRSQEHVADVALRNQRRIAEESYRTQVEQERRDLASIRMVNKYKIQAIRETERDMSSLNLAGGMVAGAASGAILGGLGHGMNSAISMQMAMHTVQVATGSNAKQLEDLRGLAFDIADKTAQSATDVAQNLAVLARSGLGDPKQLRALAGPIAQFADVQFYTRGTSFKESAMQGVQIAHMFNAYTEKAITPILETLTQVGFAMPDTLGRLQTQLGYFAPVFKGLGVSASDTIEAGALMDVAGLGKGKGGTALQNLTLNSMNSTALTKHVQGKRAAALKMLGITDDSGENRFFTESRNAQTGKFEPHYDIVGELKQIAKSLREVPKSLSPSEARKWYAERIMAVNSAFGLTGERGALALTPEAIKNFTDAINRISKASPHGMKQIQEGYMDQTGAQAQRFKSNMDSLLTDLMFPWLKEVHDGFAWMGTEAHTLQVFFHEHKDAAKAFSGGLLGIGGALALYSGATMWGAITGLASLSGAIRTLGVVSATSGAEVGVADATIGTSLLAMAPAFAEFAVVAGTIALAKPLFDAVGKLPLPDLSKKPKWANPEWDNYHPGHNTVDQAANQGAVSFYNAIFHIHGSTSADQAKDLIKHVQSAKRNPIGRVNFSSY